MLTRRSSSRMTSFALTPGHRLPVSRTLTTFGIFSRMGTPVMAVATSMPPTPMPSIPMAPPWGVWLSPPMQILPGTPKRAACTAWQMPLPGRETHTPHFRAADCR